MRISAVCCDLLIDKWNLQWDASDKRVNRAKTPIRVCLLSSTWSGRPYETSFGQVMVTGVHLTLQRYKLYGIWINAEFCHCYHAKCTGFIEITFSWKWFAESRIVDSLQILRPVMTYVQFWFIQKETHKFSEHCSTNIPRTDVKFLTTTLLSTIHCSSSATRSRFQFCPIRFIFLDNPTNFASYRFRFIFGKRNIVSSKYFVQKIFDPHIGYIKRVYDHKYVLPPSPPSVLSFCCFCPSSFLPESVFSPSSVITANLASLSKNMVKVEMCCLVCLTQVWDWKELALLPILFCRPFLSGQGYVVSFRRENHETRETLGLLICWRKESNLTLWYVENCRCFYTMQSVGLLHLGISPLLCNFASKSAGNKMRFCEMVRYCISPSCVDDRQIVAGLFASCIHKT